MELPSITIKRINEYTNNSTLTSRNVTWFKNFYYDNRNNKNLIERNEKGVNFVVGKMYTFFYFNPKYKEEMEFWNSVPVGIYIGKNKQSGHPMFLAVMFIPPKIRAQVLDKIVKINESLMDNSNKLINKSGVSMTKLETEYEDFKRYLKKSGFEFAIRSYIIKRINSQPLIITYADWWRIPTFPSKFVMKKDLRAIYYLYKKNVGIDPFRKGGEKKLNI